MWHDQSGRFSPFRADGAENVAPDIAGVARGTGACSTLGPDTGERALLANPRFNLKPYLQGLAAGCCPARLLLPLRRSFFKSSVLCIRVGFRMLRARRQTPKAQACQLFANSSLMHGDAEALFDLAFQINAPPAAQPHRFRGRDPPEPFPLNSSLLIAAFFSRQGGSGGRRLNPVPRSADLGWIRRATVEQARHALRIVTVGPIPQRLDRSDASSFLPPSCGQPHPEPGQSPTSVSAAFPSRHRAAFLAKLACGLVFARNPYCHQSLP